MKFSIKKLSKQIAIVLCVWSSSSFAKKIDIKWGMISGAEKYEYQLNRSEKFSDDMVRSGTTQNLYFVTDLGPGVYFLRVRGIDDEGRAGAWSQGSRIVVEGTALDLVKPVSSESIELASDTSAFVVEWTAVEGADDYQVLLSRGAQVRNIISPTNTLRIDGLKAGIWSLTVTARVSGQVVQKSKEISFKVVINPKPKPIIYSPVSGESTIAWDFFAIRWLNNSATPKSEVTIRRMGAGGGIVSREMVYGRAETMAPKLPPGSYQISVKNIYDTLSSDVAVVDVLTKEDAMGYHAQYFGVTGHFILGPTFGSTGFKRASYDDAAHKAFNSSGEFEFRLTGDIYDQWGIELGGGIRGDRFSDLVPVSGTGSSYVALNSTRVQPNAFLGARYRIEPLGPSKPIWLRAWLFWRQIEMPISSTGVDGGFVTSDKPGFQISNARVLGTGLGAEMRWGGYRSRWDVNGRVDVLVPWIAHGVLVGTGGVSPLWPTFELRLTPRVVMSTEIKLGLVLGGRLEEVSLKEKSTTSSKLYSLRTFVMPTLSWDL